MGTRNTVIVAERQCLDTATHRALSPGTRRFNHEGSGGRAEASSAHLHKCPDLHREMAHPTAKAPSGGRNYNENQAEAELLVLWASLLSRLLHSREGEGEKGGRAQVEVEWGGQAAEGGGRTLAMDHRSPLHPSPPAGAGVQQSQFRGRKTVSKLSSDLYSFRAFWLMKYETNSKPQQQMPVLQSS